MGQPKPRRDAGQTTRLSLLEEVQDDENAEAWREFVDGYTSLVYGYCRQRGLQESDARDVTQNVFIAVARAMPSFEYDPVRGRFRSWLGTITCREIRRYLSSNHRLHLVSGDGGQRVVLLDGDLESEWETQANDDLLRRAMALVQPDVASDVWRAFELTWIHDTAPAEAARQLGRGLPWVYKARHRVLRRLQKTVERLAEDVPMRPR